MAQALEFHRGQIEALMRAMSVAKIIREDKDPCMIEEGLYLGSFGAANNKDALKRLNLTHILTIARELNPPFPNEFVYKVLAVHDRVDVNISHYFEECFDFIEDAKRQGGGVLVHCFAGKSRSATIVIAYLMKKHGMSHSEAFQLVKSRRPVISPNAGFMTQLENYDKTLKGISRSNTVLIVLSGAKGQIYNSGFECYMIRYEYSKCYDVMQDYAPSC